MKVLVQIPAKNEEANIGEVIRSIPRSIPNVEAVDVLLIDDDSQDNTVAIAERAGVDYIIRKRAHGGLANSFTLGSKFFLSRGYDVLVNTDGDNQYFQEDITSLVTPIVSASAEMVIADRDYMNLTHFSPAKKMLQRMGSYVISAVAGAPIKDAASGFRGYSRDLVARLSVTTKFSYAMETLIQAAHSDCRIISVKSGAREVSRPSRLFRSNLEHVTKSGQAILRGLVTYRPLLTFFTLAGFLALLGLWPLVRYLVLTLSGSPGDHLQSLILGVILLSGAFTSASLAVLSDLIRSQRIIVERRHAEDRLHSNNQQFQSYMELFRAELIYTRNK